MNVHPNRVEVVRSRIPRSPRDPETMPPAVLPTSLAIRDNRYPGPPWREGLTTSVPGRMTIDSAEDVLVEFLRDLFKDYRLKTSREPFTTEEQYAADSWASRKPPAVSRGFIPRNVTGIIDPKMIPDYPRIVVQATKTDDHFGTAGRDSLLTVDILFGAYDQDPNYQGYRDVINMFERTRNAIWKAQIIGEELALREPFEFAVQPNYFPYFFGLLTTTWALFTPDYDLAIVEGSYD